MTKKTTQDAFRELEEACADFKREVVALLVSRPQVLLFWLAAWVVIRISVEVLR